MKKYRICPHCDKPVELKPVIIKGFDGETFGYMLVFLSCFAVVLSMIFATVTGIIL